MLLRARRGARRSLFPPALLALLLGTLGLFVAAPAAAQDRVIPGVPRDVRVVVSATALMLTWQAPASWGSFPAVGYQIDWAEGASPPAHSSNNWKLISPDPAPSATKFILGDRTYGTTYHLRIRARTVNPQNNSDGLVSHWVVRSGTPFHTHGPPPGKPTLAATAQTATTLSFSIACVSPGNAPVTNYELWAEKTADGSVVKHSHTVPLPCVTQTVTVPGLESGTTYRVRAYARNLFARNSEWSDWVQSTTDAQQVRGSGGSSTLMERCASHLPSNAVSVAEVRGWRDAHSDNAAHVLRWNRVLAALGDDVGEGISPMTVSESKANESRFMASRWARVTATLEAIETCLDDSGTLMERCASYLPSNAVSVAEVTGWRDAHSDNAAHVLRWNRVLAALGVDVGEGISPMTVAESKANESRFMASRWARVTATLEAIETCLANQAGGDRAPGKVVGTEEARALAIAGELSPEDAAGALLARSGLEEKQLEALDRLGNANGRYDVGDLLAWIERCRNGGARCDGSPRTPPSAAALPAAIAAGAVPRRPRRRTPRGRVRRRRRTSMLTVLFAATLWSCDAAGGPTAAVPPEPGLLTVEWTAPAQGPVAAGALVEIDGPHVGDARVAGGLELYATEGTAPRRFVLAGTMRNGAVLEFEVPDKRQAGLYSVRVVEVAGDDHRLLDADRYRAGIASN